jgi:hypothetical protein
MDLEAAYHVTHPRVGLVARRALLLYNTFRTNSGMKIKSKKDKKLCMGMPRAIELVVHPLGVLWSRISRVRISMLSK